MFHNMQSGQRLDVKALMHIQRLDRNGNVRGTIKAGTICQLYRYFDTLVIGRDNEGNYTTYLDNEQENVHYELINGKVPFPR